MALWLVRAGAHGEYEQKFLDESRIYLTWRRLAEDLGEIDTPEALTALLQSAYPDFGEGKMRTSRSQVWAFAKRMQVGDWVVLPSKHKPAIHIGEIVSEYQYDPSAEEPYRHYRKVKWLATDIPRSNFDQDLLYSFGAFLTICQISRNDAEQRVRAMAAHGWKSTIDKAPVIPQEQSDESDGAMDLAQVARDQIAHLIQAKFKGHGLARLVDAILRAQGYVTYLSPEGPDKGIDILAAPGPMGFGEPKICVQVKSGDSPLDRPTLDQLIGAMQNVQAQSGLLVSWAGFKSSVDREKATQFFRVRLWDSDDLIDQVLAHYGVLDDEIRAELPLKQVWMPALGEDEQ
ncbi:MAG: restriction endonuclease [Gammaproteobacteria bacterium]|nr:MAG: restriction endonuclease [Gammaproteobacteria bacterium]